MAKTTPRLFVDQKLAPKAEVTLSPEQSHYLANVLRLAPGDVASVFNARMANISRISPKRRRRKWCCAWSS